MFLYCILDWKKKYKNAKKPLFFKGFRAFWGVIFEALPPLVIFMQW